MATITSSGAISGLNVSSLVSQLVAAERGTYDARFTRAEAKVTTQMTALAQLKSAMSGFRTALGALEDPEDFSPRRVSIDDDQFFTATATSAAAAGRYDVEVLQLAQAAQLGSLAFAGGQTTVVGTGTLTLALGAESFSVTLASGANTLADLRDAINNASGNVGVRATIIRDVAGAHLVLSGTDTGAASTLRITASGGDGNLAQFAYDPPGTPGTYAVLSAAQDAVVRVAGYEIRSADNSIEGAIDGVTLNLRRAEPGTTASLSVATDDAAIRDRVSGFVNAYNTLAKQIARLRSYDAETKAAGPLLGDAMLRNVEGQLRRLVSDPVSGSSGNYTALVNIGITSAVDGTLTLDQTRFDAALAADPLAVARLFTSAEGVASRVGDFLDRKLATDGELASRDAGLASRQKDITKQREALDARMQLLQARYTKQFNALDSLLTQLQSTSSYLSQQLASLPGSSG